MDRTFQRSFAVSVRSLVLRFSVTSSSIIASSFSGAPSTPYPHHRRGLLNSEVDAMRLEKHFSSGLVHVAKIRLKVHLNQIRK